MNGWLLPLSASAFWAGLLLAPGVGPRLPWIAAIGAGGTLLVGVALLAGPPEDVVGAAGIVEDRFEPAPMAAVVTARSTGRAPAGVLLCGALAGVLLLGVGRGALAARRVASSPLRAVAPRVVTLEGRLRTDPSPSVLGWHAVLDARLATWDGEVVALRESVWLSGFDRLRAVRGDRLRVTGSVEVPDDPEFSGILRRRGIAVEMRSDEVVLLGGASDPILRSAQTFRAFVGRSIKRLFPQPEAGLLLGLALGDDSDLDEGLERDFSATGLGHLLVVSGENVAMVLAPVLGLATWLRLSRWPTFVLGGATLLFFVVLTGAEPSVMRAGVMAALTLFGVLIGRPRSTASILAAAVLILLVVDPTLVWAIGFQLSVAATAGMVALATTIAERLRFLPRALAVAAGATIAAQLAVTPLLLFHFHEVPVVTVVANVFAFPAVSPALLLGLLAGAIGVVSPALARPVAALAILPMRYLEVLADRLAKAPVPWITSGGGLGALIVGGLLVAAVAWWFRTRPRVPRTALVAAVVVLPVLVWSRALSSGPPAGLVVHFFDVGQGDGALVVSPGGATVLVDAGPDDGVVAGKLSALGIKRIDVAVATHPHADHVSGFPAVFARLPVGVVLEPGCGEPSPSFGGVLRSIADERLDVQHPRTGDAYQVGDMRLDVLAPDECVHGTPSDPDNDSIVLRVSLGEDVVLFTGDAEEPSQQTMLDEGASLSADLLKVPHHGAGTSLATFFDAVAADVAVVSVGIDNPYGHPVPETLAELRASGAQVRRTDLEGDVTIEFASDGPLIASAG